MQIIGVMGQKRSGKDSLASRMVEEHGFTRVGFADSLKAAALAVNPRVFGAPPNVIESEIFKGVRDPWNSFAPVPLAYYVDTWGWEEAKKHPEVRRILQELGVAMRGVDEALWVRAAMNKIGAAPSNVVVPDVRFPNEVEALRNAGAWIVRVDRPGLTDTDTHVSEHAWRDIEPDVIVDNDGTLEDLWMQADQIVSEATGSTFFGARLDTQSVMG